MNLHRAIKSCEECHKYYEKLKKLKKSGNLEEIDRYVNLRGNTIIIVRNYLLAELEKTTIGAMIKAHAVDAALEACWNCDNSGFRIKKILEERLDVSLKQ